MCEVSTNADEQDQAIVLEPIAVSYGEPAGLRPWGFWATAGWGLLGGLVYLGGAIIAGVIFLVLSSIQQPNFQEDEFLALAEGLESSGLFLAAGTLASGLPLMGLVALLAWSRTGQVGAYLGLRRPTGAAVLRWCGIMAAVMVLVEGVTVLSGVDSVPEVMRACYRTAGSLPFFYFVLVIAAPFFEEIFFRGFLFEGFSKSTLGGRPTVVLTAALWAGIHVQYEPFMIATIFVMGLVLGAARLRTGSTWLAMVLHGMNNLVATVQTAWVVGAEG